jgi:hypothetical protein
VLPAAFREAAQQPAARRLIRSVQKYPYVFYAALEAAAWTPFVSSFLSTSSLSQRHTVLPLIEATRPLPMTSAANSAALQRDHGTP